MYRVYERERERERERKGRGRASTSGVSDISSISHIWEDYRDLNGARGSTQGH